MVTISVYYLNFQKINFLKTLYKQLIVLNSCFIALKWDYLLDFTYKYTNSKFHNYRIYVGLKL